MAKKTAIKNIKILYNQGDKVSYYGNVYEVDNSEPIINGNDVWLKLKNRLGYVEQGELRKLR